MSGPVYGQVLPQEAADWLQAQRLEEKVRMAEASLSAAETRLRDAERMLRLARAGAEAVWHRERGKK